MDEDWESEIQTKPSMSAFSGESSKPSFGESGFGTDSSSKFDSNNNTVADEWKPFSKPAGTNEADENSKDSFGRNSNFKSSFVRRDKNENNDNENRGSRGFGSFGDRSDSRRDNFMNRDSQERRPFGAGGYGERNNSKSGRYDSENKRSVGFKDLDSKEKEGSSGFGGFGNKPGFDRAEGGFGRTNDRNNRVEGGFRSGERSNGFRSNNNESGGSNFEERREGGFGGGMSRRFGNRNEDSQSRGQNEGSRGGFGSSGGFGNRNENSESRNRNEGSSGFGGFGRRNNNDGDQEEKRDFGFRRGQSVDKERFKRSDENNDGNSNGFSFKGRDQNGSRGGFGSGEQRGFNRERRKSDSDNKDGAKEPVKYRPQEKEYTEETLFHNVSVGINFQKQSEIPVKVTGNQADTINPIESFDEANLSDLLMSNIKKCNYVTPTPVQKYAVPIILAKRDLMACAQTGSGKTAAYFLPILTNILHDGLQSSELSMIQEPQALILSPTRELALQIFEECVKFSFGSIIKTCILYGGVQFGYQISKLKKGCNILIATPGRLLDVLKKNIISLAKVKYFVLDEADRMLDMGFQKDVREILDIGSISKTTDRNTFMFSATFPKEVQLLAQDFLNDYLFLTVGVVGGANTDVSQIIYQVDKFGKRDKIIEILNDIGNEKVMIFVEHKKYADVLGFFLVQKGYQTTTIHGDRLQQQREEALSDFKSGKCNIIVATSVAARGLDIEKVNHVINHDLPQTIDEYVHRIGRTGRCGNLGKAISFFDPSNENDTKLARSLVMILTQAQQEIPEWLNEAAENSYGTSFNGNNCTADLRNKMHNLHIQKPEPVSFSSTNDKPASSFNNEENWE
jgi:probable ATP-dependent RNA helicase DDX4